MYNRLLKKPLKFHPSFFLFYPSGMIKTSWFKPRISKAFNIYLLNQEIFFDLLKNLNKIEEMISMVMLT